MNGEGQQRGGMVGCEACGNRANNREQVAPSVRLMQMF